MSRDFPGTTSDYLNVGDVSPIDITGTALTIHAWIRPDTVSGVDRIAAKWTTAASGHQYMLQLNGAKVDARIGDGSADDLVTGATNVSASVWSAVAMRKNGTGANALQVFLNGTLDGSVTSNKSMPNTTSALRFGIDSSATANCFDGQIAEIAIWNVALNDHELKALADGADPRTIRPASLKGYWPLAGTTSTERDFSGNGSHASMTGTVPAGTAHAPKQLVDLFDGPTDLLFPAGAVDYTDSATITVDIQASGTESAVRDDSATVYVNITASGFDAKSPPNDDFANAQALSTTLPGTLSGLSTFDSTEEAGEVRLGSDYDQSIWYKFTPTVSGWYKFKVPLSSLSYHGTHGVSSGELEMSIFNATADTLAEMTSANRIANDFMYTDPGWQSQHDGTLVAELVSGTTYWLKFHSSFGLTLNRSSVDFDLQWDTADTAGNADFASRITLTGASGTEDVFLGVPSWQSPDEPASAYWNRGSMGGMATVWYEWTCPASGWYQFELEADTNGNISPDIAIYTGSALNALTPVVKNEVGSYSTIAVDNGQTKVRFNATSGTNYKIQVAGSGYSAIAWDINLDLRWSTAGAPSGDTGATALNGQFNTARRDNLGNTDNDPPPNAVTRLSAHDDWWYTDGAVGRSKWFKSTITEDGTLRIEAGNYLDEIHTTYMEYALLVYKGASFGSITAATAQSSIDAVMIGYQGGDIDFIFSGVARALNDDPFLDVPVTTGETVWLCLVTLYDKDVNGEATQTAFPEDAPQGEIDLKFGTSGAPEVPPDNDNFIGLPFGYEFILGRSEFGGYDAESYATQREGYTYLATPEAGEGPVAGFGPARTVWYGLDLPTFGSYKIWVESDVDCVMAVYNWPFFGTLGSLIDEDDDSGPGDNPELELILSAGAYAVVVDSKTEGFFTLKYQLQVGGTPPANDNFTDAEEITSLPFSAVGSTIGASAEPFEREAEQLGVGPKDTVWYKYVADHDGQLTIKATVANNLHDDAYVYVDTWKGTTEENLERWPEPPPTGPGGGLWKGFFSYFDTPLEIDLQAITMDVVNGETYYIRVQSESGGSEDFTIYVDEQELYINIQPSGLDVGPFNDEAEVYVNITASGSEIHHEANAVDSAEVYINVQASGTELQAKEYADSATVNIDIQFMGGECYSTFSGLMMDSEADLRWTSSATTNWTAEYELRWTVGDVQVEGINC